MSDGQKTLEELRAELVLAYNGYAKEVPKEAHFGIGMITVDHIHEQPVYKGFTPEMAERIEGLEAAFLALDHTWDDLFGLMQYAEKICKARQEAPQTGFE